MTDKHDDDTREQYLEARLEEAWIGQSVDPREGGHIVCPCCGRDGLRLYRVSAYNPTENVYCIEFDPDGAVFSEIDGASDGPPSVTLSFDCDNCNRDFAGGFYLTLSLENGRTTVRWG
jgi:hypothetical protein